MPFNGQGFSLFELLICMALVGVLLGWSLPRMTPLWTNFELRQAASNVMVKVNKARSLAMHSERRVVLRFANNQLCYGFESDTEYCEVVHYQLPSKFHFQSDDSLTFSAGRGFLLPNAGNLSVVSSDTHSSIRIVVSGLGRVRWCQMQISMSDTIGVPGVPNCE